MKIILVLLGLIVAALVLIVLFARSKRGTARQDYLEILAGALSMAKTGALSTPRTQARGVSLELGRSSESDVVRFVGLFPGHDKVSRQASYEGTYRFVQAYFADSWVCFDLGNENDRWKGRLYSVAASTGLPGETLQQEQTDVFQQIVKRYGNYTKVEKFQLSGSGTSDLDYYVWRLSNVVLTYRCFVDRDKEHTTLVVEIWDAEFFDTHSYWDY